MRAPVCDAPAPATPPPLGTVPASPRHGYLAPKDAAKFTGISYQELERLRRAGGGPKFCAVTPRLIRYAVDDLCGWLDSFKVSNAAQAHELHREAAEGVARG